MVCDAKSLSELLSLVSLLVSNTKYANLDSKEFWNLEELCVYTGFERSYILKLTSRKLIPFHKPNGKSLFFKSAEIKAWLQTNLQDEIDKTLAEVFTDKKIR